MSIEAITWALSAPLGGNQKVLLIGAANHAHPDGSEAYPSLDTLARYACCDRSTARRNVRKLVADGWLIEDGLGPKGQTKYRLPLDADPVGLQNATGGNQPQGGLQNTPSGGGTATPPEPSLEPSIEPSRGSASARDELAEVWGHYQQAMPNGSRCALSSARRLIIVQALKVRTVVECKRAIDGLAVSDYHVGNGYTDIKYALRGGGRGPEPDATIDRMMKVAAGQVRNGHGNGNGGVLHQQVWPDGRTWDELTRAEQENAKTAMTMGEKPWLPREQPMPVSNGNGHTPGITSDDLVADAVAWQAAHA